MPSNDDQMGTVLYHALRARRFTLISAIGASLLALFAFVASLPVVLRVMFPATAILAWYSFARQAMLIRVLRRHAS